MNAAGSPFLRTLTICFKPDSGAKQIVRVRRNGEPAAFMNHLANLARRLSLQIRKRRADTEKMTIGCRHLHAGQDQEIIDRQTVEPHQAFLEQVIDRVAGVVIGNRDAVQPFGARGSDQIFRTGNTVPGKKRMRMQIDIERHFQEASLEGVKWKALVSRNGPLSVKRSGAVCKPSFYAKAVWPKAATDSVLVIANFFSSRLVFTNNRRKSARSTSNFQCDRATESTSTFSPNSSS